MQAARSFALFSLANSLLHKLSRDPQASGISVTYESMGVDAAALSDSIVQRYFRNYKMVDALARQYGFEYAFVWAPHLSNSRKPLVADEKEIMQAVDPALMKLYHLTHQNIVRSAGQHRNFYYLGNVFDEYQSHLWIDDAHVTPVGNQMIAAKILEIVTQSKSFKRVEKSAVAEMKLPHPRSPSRQPG
jgi:hypothetical protein